ncbi:MAG TPA: M13 family metallopeptidase [Flavobacteriales bacterium]|nr:M13 family metallopeptidase [Flavobacteriales bacterium]
MKKAVLITGTLAGILTLPVNLVKAGVNPESSSQSSAIIHGIHSANPGFTYEANAKTVDFQDMDPSVDPSVDFFDFVNGKWIKNTAIPASEASWGKFNILSDNNNKVLRNIVESTAKQKNEKGSVNQLIGDFYFTLMDSVKREKDGIKPIQAELAAIDALKDKKDLAKYLAHIHRFGMPGFFGTQVEQDMKDNTKMMLYFGQGGFSLPSNEYYTKKDTASEEIKKAYRAHLKTMFGFLGKKAGDAEKAAMDVYGIESMLADSSATPLEERDIQAQYNKMTWDAFKKMSPSFNWDVYSTTIGLTAPAAEVIVTVPKAFRGLENILAKKTLPEIKNYLKWQVFLANSQKLSLTIEKEQFKFFGTTLRGAKQMKPLWKRALGVIGGSAANEALGHAFVDKTFSPEAKKRVNEMVDNIFIAFKQRLDTLEWMSPDTRKKAHEKLGSFIRKLGYPDKWTDYSKLNISRASLVQNAWNCNEFDHLQNLAKLNAAIDKGEWQMPPHIVNAYYNPLWNEIVFPAGIMQPPFFDVTKEDAVNYARMGAVIGHELTHGFDDQGAQFDASGNLANWWLPEDLKNFESRTQKLIDCFNSYEALPGIYVNGALTIGENIADLGGLKIAYYAYQHSLKGKTRETINGFSPEQRFFIAYGQIWCTKYTEKALKNQIYTNVHAPGKYRVLGPLSNMKEFFAAFDIKEGSKMRMPEDKMAKIW